MKKAFLLSLMAWAQALPQATPANVRGPLSQTLHSGETVDFQLRAYIRRLVPPMPAPATAEEWMSQVRRIREKTLREVVFRGWPREWIEGSTKFEDLGTIPTNGSYRLRKLRYEVVPAFFSVALLYEPAVLRGKAPAILNLNGHEPEGKFEEYIQKRCIAQAMQGVIALNLEWINGGELAHPENAHWFGAHVDFAGANALGLFYLEMRRGLDYLVADPRVDPARIGITGLSGGGWQSIVLSALEERISVAVPVAGYLPSASFGGVEHAGDNEQTATDFSSAVDYPVLTAMRAPKPTLLIYNAEDDCCFRAARMKPDLYDRVRPFFRLYGREENFAWHENLDPGTHNYQLDNRLHSYRFFARYFGLPAPVSEPSVDGLIKSREELTVGLPKDQLTILGVARKLAARISRPPLSPPSEERAKLSRILRYKPAAIDHAAIVANTKSRGIETRSYRFDFRNGLSATGVWFKAIAVPDRAPATLILDDGGKKTAAVKVADRVNRGEQVLAVDLLFTGDAAPAKFLYPDHDRMLVTLGERSLGLRVAQLTGLARWMYEISGSRKIRVEAGGMRSQGAAIAAAALEPQWFERIIVRRGLMSWGDLLDKPVKYEDAFELFCPDLYKEFDLDRLAQIAAPLSVEKR